MKRVLIVGAGFSGFLTAKQLVRRLRGQVQMTLVDPKDHFLFAPMLIDVLQGDLKPEEICIGLSQAAGRFGFGFRQGQITSINREQKTAELVFGNQTETLSYDILVLSQGAQTNYFGNVGAEKNAFPLKSLKDAARLFSRIEWCVREASAKADEMERRRLLSFAVVGAGATGIEALCSIQRLAHGAALPFPELKKDMQFHIFQAQSQILPGFPLRLVRFALAECEKRGLMVHCGVPVTEVTESSIACADGSRYDASCILWSAGLAPNAIPSSTEMPKAGPWIGVDAFLRVSPDEFAAGDIVSASYQKLIVPKNAQTAKQMASVLVENIARTLESRLDLVPFRYFSKGTLLVMGHQGYADFRIFGLPGRWVGKIRTLFYRHMLWQMRG